MDLKQCFKIIQPAANFQNKNVSKSCKNIFKPEIMSNILDKSLILLNLKTFIIK